MSTAAKLARAGLLATGPGLLVWSLAANAQNERRTSPVFGVSLPPGYRRWELVAPARESAPLGEFRAVLGNAIAVEACRRGKLPFPDGAILVKLALKEVPSADFEPAAIPGAATTVHVMVKDSKRTPQLADGGSGCLSTVSPPARLNTRPAFPTMKHG